MDKTAGKSNLNGYLSKTMCGLALVAALVATMVTLAQAAPLTLTYSGRLSASNGKPLDGPIDMEVRFFKSASGSDEYAVGPFIYNATALSQGIFQIEIVMTDSESHSGHLRPSVTSAVLRLVMIRS